MTDPKEDPVLAAVATTIADGLPVDWESLFAEQPHLAEELRELRILQEVRAAGRADAKER